MIIRIAEQQDFDQLGAVMFDAVRRGPSPYSEEQRAAWLPKPNAGEVWASRLRDQFVVMADSDGKATGFISVTKDNHIDLAFIRPRAQGTGLFRALYERIEKRAVEGGARALTVDASVSALPAFGAMGFTTQFEETVNVRGQSLKRYRMSKVLG